MKTLLCYILFGKQIRKEIISENIKTENQKFLDKFRLFLILSTQYLHDKIIK